MSLLVLLMLSLLVFSLVVCVCTEIYFVISFVSLCFTCVACLLFRLNNKSSQKLVQDRKSPMVRVKYFVFTSSVAVVAIPHQLLSFLCVLMINQSHFERNFPPDFKLKIINIFCVWVYEHHVTSPLETFNKFLI